MECRGTDATLGLLPSSLDALDLALIHAGPLKGMLIPERARCHHFVLGGFFLFGGGAIVSFQLGRSNGTAARASSSLGRNSCSDSGYIQQRRVGAARADSASQPPARPKVGSQILGRKAAIHPSIIVLETCAGWWCGLYCRKNPHPTSSITRPSSTATITTQMSGRPHSRSKHKQHLSLSQPPHSVA